MFKKRKEEDQERASSKQNKKLARARSFVGKDLCACGYNLLCQGECRINHTNECGFVQCHALYQINEKDIKRSPRDSKNKVKIDFKNRKRESTKNRDDS